jgi:sec-independent protein translocase protein TatB
MNLLGIGPFELLLILVIATIVLGPERMAQAGRTLGRLYAKYRYRWQKDVDEMTRELRRELAMLQKELDEIRHTAEDEIKTAQSALKSAVDTQIDLDAVTTKGDLPDAQDKTSATEAPHPAQPQETTGNKVETEEVAE